MKYFYLFLLIFLPVFAQADIIKRTGKNVSLPTDEIVYGNFYAVGNAVDITGLVQGDAVLVGGNVVVVGTVDEDGLMIGSTIAMNGTIKEDLRIVAGEATISGVVDGNLTIIGGRVKILSTAVIGGDVMIYGGDAIIEGEIAGFLYGTVNSLRINGLVKAGINVTTSNLQFGSKAKIDGNVSYVSNQDLVRASDAQIIGQIIKNSPPTVTDTDFSFRLLVVQFLVLLFTVLVIYLVAKPSLERFVAYPMFKQSAVLKAGLFGFIFLFLPVAMGVLLVSILGLFLGVLGLLLYFVFLLLAVLMLPFVLAKLTMRAFGQQQLKLSHIILGVMSGIGFLHLPVIGLFLILSLYIFTLGTMLSLIFTRLYRH